MLTDSPCNNLFSFYFKRDSSTSPSESPCLDSHQFCTHVPRSTPIVSDTTAMRFCLRLLPVAGSSIYPTHYLPCKTSGRAGDFRVQKTNLCPGAKNKDGARAPGRAEAPEVILAVGHLLCCGKKQKAGDSCRKLLSMPG